MTGSCQIPIVVLKGKFSFQDLAESFQKKLGRAYTDLLPIKTKKLQDVMALISNVVLPEDVTFYSFLRDSEDAHSDAEDDTELDTIQEAI